MSYHYGHASTGWTLYSAGNGAQRQVCASHNPPAPPLRDRHTPRRRRGHTFSALHHECRGHPVARPAAARACSTARPLYHRPTRHSASTPRPYVVAAPSPVCTSRLKAHFCRSLSSTNVCTSRLMRVRNGRTLQLCPTITVTHQPDGLYSAGYGTHVKCASQL